MTHAHVRRDHDPYHDSRCRILRARGLARERERPDCACPARTRSTNRTRTVYKLYSELPVAAVGGSWYRVRSRRSVLLPTSRPRVGGGCVRARERSDWWMRAREYFARLVGARTLRLTHTRHSVVIFVIRPFSPSSAPFALATRSGVRPVQRRFNLFNFFSPFFFFIASPFSVRHRRSLFSQQRRATNARGTNIFHFSLIASRPSPSSCNDFILPSCAGRRTVSPRFFFCPHSLIFGVLLLCRRH